MDDIPSSSGDFPAVFSGAVGRLQVAVLEACRGQEAWPAKVAAAIAAAIDFAATEPESVQVLTVEALIQRPDGGRRYVRTIEHFAELLRAEAPVDERRPKSTEQALVGGVATTIADRMRHDTPRELRAAVPELVEFVLLPYVGSAEAKRWAGWVQSRGP
jgi:hypothetical protein